MGVSPSGVWIKVPRRKHLPDPAPPGPLGVGPSLQPNQPDAFTFFDIDASTGRLTIPVAATFPAVRAEIPRNCLRDEFITCTSWLTKSWKNEIRLIINR